MPRAGFECPSIVVEVSMGTGGHELLIAIE